MFNTKSITVDSMKKKAKKIVDLKMPLADFNPAARRIIIEEQKKKLFKTNTSDGALAQQKLSKNNGTNSRKALEKTDSTESLEALRKRFLESK